MRIILSVLTLTTAVLAHQAATLTPTKVIPLHTEAIVEDVGIVRPVATLASSASGCPHAHANAQKGVHADSHIHPHTYNNPHANINSHSHGQGQQQQQTHPTPHKHAAWTFAIASIVGISLLSLVGALTLPIQRKYPHVARYLMPGMICLSVGTLVGDAVMHLIPHALEIHVHGANAAKYLDPAGKEKRTIIVCCVIILGMYMFFVLERMLQKYHHGHSHAHVCHGQVHETSCNETKVVEDKETEQQKLKPVGILIIAGEVLHNFVDGLVIGAAFTESLASGFATAITVALHEIPHELGDYAILINSGFKPMKALMFSFSANLSALVGCIIGLTTFSHVENPFYRHLVYAFTAGNFLYIALADLIPEIQHSHEEEEPVKSAATLEEIEVISARGAEIIAKPTHTLHKAHEHKNHEHKHSEWIMWFVQHGGMWLGFVAMLLIAIYEHNMENMFSAKTGGGCPHGHH